MQKPMTKAYAFTAAGLLVALVAAMGVKIWLDRGRDPFAVCRAGEVVSGAAAIGGPFTLIDEAGKTVTDKDVIKGPVLVYFGYTFCPDVCPVDSARNADAADILAKRGYDVTPVFISFDTKRDTPQVLKEFTANFSPKMIGLTGTPENIKAAAREYKVYYKMKNADSPYYLFDHSTFTYLMMPGHGFVDFFRDSLTPQQLADRVACYVDKSRGI